MYDYFVPSSVGALVGNDYAGTVVALGPSVTRYSVGDRIAGIAPGNINQSPDGGAFAEFVLGDVDLSFRIPDAMAFEDAATLGTAITTVGQSLYQSLQLPWPAVPAPAEEEAGSVLIYGGSSSMGTLAVQYAKLSGCKVVSTASPANFALVKAMGADEVFDYVSTQPRHTAHGMQLTLHSAIPMSLPRSRPPPGTSSPKPSTQFANQAQPRSSPRGFLPLPPPQNAQLTLAASVPPAANCTTCVPST